MSLTFAKMHGLGNDFMVIDLITQDCELTPERVRCWADRRTGIGFDQLLVIEPPGEPDTDFRYRIYNADGGEVEQCGNGARCAAQFINRRRLSPKTRLTLQTLGGPIETRLLDDGHVEVDLGVPSTEPAEVPYVPEAACTGDGAHATGAMGASRDGGPTQLRRFRLRAADGTHELTPVSVGNPHGVLFVPNIADAPVEAVGAALGRHPFFPEGANIGFCQVVDGNFARLRVFERGVGETRACGTGACAAVVAGHLAGLLADRVKVSLPGGKVRVSWKGPGTTVKLSGPATLTYEGQLP